MTTDAVDWATIMEAVRQWVLRGSGLPDGKVYWYYDGGPREKAPCIELAIDSIGQTANDWTELSDNPFVFADKTVSLVDPVANALTCAGHGLLTGDGAVHLTTTGVIPGGLAVAHDYWIHKLDANRVQLGQTFFDAMGDPTPVLVDITSAGSGVLKIVKTAVSERVGEELKRTTQGDGEVVIRMQCFALPGSVVDAVRLLSNVISSLPLNDYDLEQAGIGIVDLGTTTPQQGVIKSVEGRRGSILEPRAIVDVTGYVATSMSDFINYIQRIQAKIQAQTPGGATLPDIPVEITR